MQTTNQKKKKHTNACNSKGEPRKLTHCWLLNNATKYEPGKEVYCPVPFFGETFVSALRGSAGQGAS